MEIDSSSTETKVVSANCIKEGDVVILRTNDNQYRISKPIFPKGQTSLGRKTVAVDTLIGKTWGSTFEIKGGKLELVKGSSPAVIDTEESTNAETENTGSGDDKQEEELPEESPGDKGFDGVQKLSQQKILAMKEKGVSGSDIIKELTKQSTTFKDKTEFAKQKYIAKKSKKHLSFCTAIKPSALTLTQAYFQNKPANICHLRFDSLAQLLTLSNVQAESNALVVDGGMGVLLGAVTERTAGYGKVLNVYLGQQPSVEGLKLFNFPQQVIDSVYNYPIDSIPELRRKMSNKNSSLEASKQENAMNVEATTSQASLKEAEKERREKAEEFLRQQADCLIIATKLEPEPILFALYPFLAPARSFAVFSLYMEPLALIQQKLFERGIALNLDLSETWMREYQVLPARTHPLMRMHGASGYVLSGIKVIEEDGEKGTKKQKTQ